jgi:hypothetical protein
MLWLEFLRCTSSAGWEAGGVTYHGNNLPSLVLWCERKNTHIIFIHVAFADYKDSFRCTSKDCSLCAHKPSWGLFVTFIVCIHLYFRRTRALEYWCPSLNVDWVATMHLFIRKLYKLAPLHPHFLALCICLLLLAVNQDLLHNVFPESSCVFPLWKSQSI